jgi:hypothetical protein
MRGRLLAVTVFLSLLLSPTYATVHQAVNEQSSGGVTMDSIRQAFSVLWDQLRGTVAQTSESISKEIGTSLAIQLGDASSNSTDSLDAIFGNKGSTSSNFTIDFIGHVFDIRKQLLEINVEHSNASSIALNGVLALTVAFVVAMLLFAISAILTVIQFGFSLTKEGRKHHPTVSYGQQLVAMLYMIPYTAYYVMMALMIAVGMMVCLVVGREIIRILGDTELIAKISTLGSSLSTLVSVVGEVLHTYINEKMPTKQQVQELAYQIERVANATMALAIAFQKGDQQLAGMTLPTIPSAPTAPTAPTAVTPTATPTPSPAP